MSTTTISVAIGIAALAVLVLLLFVQGRGRGRRITPLGGIAFAFVIAGILFGDEPMLGYTLIAVGVALSLVDLLLRSRR